MYMTDDTHRVWVSKLDNRYMRGITSFTLFYINLTSPFKDFYKTHNLQEDHLRMQLAQFKVYVVPLY